MSQFKKYMEVVNEARAKDKVSGPLELTAFEKRERKKQMELNKLSDYQKPKTYPWDGTPKSKSSSKGYRGGGYDSSVNTFNIGMTSDDYGYGPKNTESDYEKKIKKDKAMADYYDELSNKGLPNPRTDKKLTDKAMKYKDSKEIKDLLKKYHVVADIPVTLLKKALKNKE